MATASALEADAPHIPLDTTLKVPPADPAVTLILLVVEVPFHSEVNSRCRGCSGDCGHTVYICTTTANGIVTTYNSGLVWRPETDILID